MIQCRKIVSFDFSPYQNYPLALSLLQNYGLLVASLQVKHAYQWIRYKGVNLFRWQFNSGVHDKMLLYKLQFATDLNEQMVTACT